MGTNRIAELFRDPTMGAVSTDYFIVRFPWDSIVVGREAAAAIVAAVNGFDPSALIRCRTVHGSEVFVRADAVMYIRECTEAQRDAERRFWKAIDDEEESARNSAAGDATASPETEDSEEDE